MIIFKVNIISHDISDVCRPGFHSHRKQLYHAKRLSLEPCLPCQLGFYESQYGQDHCSSCPSNMTTKTLASTGIKDCYLEPDRDNVCQLQPCENQGRCVQNEHGDFSCDCPNHFVGKYLIIQKDKKIHTNKFTVHYHRVKMRNLQKSMWFCQLVFEWGNMRRSN